MVFQAYSKDVCWDRGWFRCYWSHLALKGVLSADYFTQDFKIQLHFCIVVVCFSLNSLWITGD